MLSRRARRVCPVPPQPDHGCLAEGCVYSYILDTLIKSTQVKSIQYSYCPIVVFQFWLCTNKQVFILRQIFGYFFLIFFFSLSLKRTERRPGGSERS
jgi:hypothetical protein